MNSCCRQSSFCDPVSDSNPDPVSDLDSDPSSDSVSDPVSDLESGSVLACFWPGHRVGERGQVRARNNNI